MDPFDAYRSLINRELESTKALFDGPLALKEAALYALLGPGRRYRPALLLMVAEAAWKHSTAGAERALDAALAVECFHAASLIADDLPCMDDEKERRGMAPLHLAFDEKTAILASYSLIAAGYQLIGRALGRLDPLQRGAVAELALASVSRATGAQGASGGQYLDLMESLSSFDEVLLAIRMKTVTLFELSFSLGWLFGGGDPSLLDKVERAAGHFGLAFQIADDLGDYEKDLASGRVVNVVRWIGVEAAEKMFHVETRACQALLKELGLQTIPLGDHAMGASRL